MSTDFCPTGCGRQHNATKTVMCGACWAKVPKPLQRAVYVAWRKRGALSTDWHSDAALRAREEHEAAKAAAIRAAS